MKEILIIDGYNIIYAWPDTASLLKEDLEHARERLIEETVQYAKIKGYEKTFLVFDAHLVKGGSGSTETIMGIEIIYTQEGITADTVIEKLAAKYAQDFIVYVATSDWPEQRAVLGHGAVRLSAREFINEVQNTLQDNLTQQKNNNKHGERQLGWRLNSETLDVLERVRRKK